MRSFLVVLATVSLVVGDASAKALKGDERKGFMSECLKAEKKS